MENPTVSLEVKRDKDGLITSVQCKVEPASGKDAVEGAQLAAVELVSHVFDSESDQPYVYIPVDINQYKD